MEVFHDCANSRWACERESQKSWCTVQVQEGRSLTSRRHQDPWWGACHWGQGLCWKVINTNLHFFGQICCQSSSSATAIQVENSLGGELVLDNVPIVTPNCDLVVPSLSLTVTLTIGHYDYDVVIIIFPSSWQQVLWWLYWYHGCTEYTKNPILKSFPHSDIDEGHYDYDDAESVPHNGNDNLSVTLTASIVMIILMSWG